jgi:hypothetical protein
MSGLASGLRASRWNTAPESPKAAPTRIAVRARGMRSVRTMKSEPGSPCPAMLRRTSPIGTGKSPTASDQQNTAKVRADTTTVTSTARACTRVDRPSRRKRNTTSRS